MDYDEYEDLYADELALADELHSYEPPVQPSNRVLRGRDDVSEQDTPRSSSSVAKRTLEEMAGSSLEHAATPIHGSVRKKLRLEDDASHSTSEFLSPKKLIIDEGRQGADCATVGVRTAEDDDLATLPMPSPPPLASTEEELFQTQWQDASSYVLTIGLRGSNGRLRFVGLRDDSWADDVELLLLNNRHKGNLLSRPFWDVWIDAQAELERQQHLEFERTANIVKSLAVNSLPEGVVVDKSGGADPGDTSSISTSLWVDKYRPLSFTDLLSDDGVNRTLLQWLKLWDCIVFGRPQKMRLYQEKHITANNQKNFVKRYMPEVKEELDEHKRPQQKVVLLYGPPGLGKTTLAHVIARHAGYNVVELNASDDRSPEVFKAVLETATQMQAVLGQDPRPNCLVIDEIDGAPAPSINVLVNMIKFTGQSAGKKKKKEGSLLLRPIICICNELYVPALRPLRQIALMLHFPATQKGRLCNRLLEVMRRERMKGDQTAVAVLCEKAGNDVRSCLSTLQFIHGRKKHLTLTDVCTLNVGQKDVQRGLFSLLQEVFQKPRTGRKVFRQHLNENAFSKAVKNPDSQRFDSLVRSAQGFGDYEKLIQALFDNYVNVKFKDPHFELIHEGPEWLCFTDELLATVHRLQNYSLYPYLPFVASAFHRVFSVVPYTKMVFQNSFIEARTKQTQMHNILVSLTVESTPQARCFLTETSLLRDVLPWLLCILQPTLRPVNMQLFNKAERQQVQQVIAVMSSFAVTYQQSRNVDGVYQYSLEPNIEDIVHFPGIPPHQPLPYATRQLIARELEVEKMRRSDLSEKTVVTNLGPTAGATPSWAPAAQLAPKVVEQPTRPSVDFFGRVIQKPAVTAVAGSSCAGKVSSSQVWYQFKEGFSNAVRRTVRIKDLL